ncbi:MAG: hypothetical protein ACOX7H_06620 [Bacillota bacterium]
MYWRDKISLANGDIMKKVMNIDERHHELQRKLFADMKERFLWQSFNTD